MKRLGILLALCAATTLGMASFATEVKADQQQSKSADPNMRLHNGKWWYWQAPQQRWMVWNGSEWQVHQPGRSVRTYSYIQEDFGNSGFRGTQTTRPRSGGRITESGGIRDAGSKIRGNY